MRLRHIASVLSPVVLIIGCDLIPQAYNDGFSCGYQTVDAFFSCARACDEQRQQREAEIQQWEDACAGSLHDHFTTQNPIDDADAHCANQYVSRREILVCADTGQEPGTHLPGCSPFEEPTFTTVEANYRCPPGTLDGANKLCLCCDNPERPACSLSGGSCRTDEGCCDGACVLEEAADAGPGDAGRVPPRRGTCE